jgi:serine protease Do
VGADSPAGRAGVRPYDVIVGTDGTEVRSDEDLVRLMAAKAPGTMTALDIVRGAARERILVKVVERPIPAAAQGRMRPVDARQAVASDQGPLGLTARDLDPASALRRALPDSIRGVVVVEVDPAGPARLARIRTGQLILEVNRTPTPTADRFEAVLASVRPGLAVVVLVYDPIADKRALVAIAPDRRP